MPFRFSRRIKLFPGVRLNVSKSGVSTSIGRCAAWLTFGPRGTRTTVGIPGTGVSYTETHNALTAHHSAPIVDLHGDPQFPAPPQSIALPTPPDLVSPGMTGLAVVAIIALVVFGFALFL